MRTVVREVQDDLRAAIRKATELEKDAQIGVALREIRGELTGIRTRLDSLVAIEKRMAAIEKRLATLVTTTFETPPGAV